MPRFYMDEDFKVIHEGLLYSSAGTQSNCAGIAAILGSVVKTNSKDIEFTVQDYEHWSGDVDNDGYVPGARVREVYRNAVFEGAKEAFEVNGITSGYKFTLVEAMMSAVDSNPNKFSEAGKRMVEEWLKLAT